MGRTTQRTVLGVNRLECRDVPAAMTGSFTLPEGPIGGGKIRIGQEKTIVLPAKIVRPEIGLSPKQISTITVIQPMPLSPAETTAVVAVEAIGEHGSIAASE